MVVCFWQEFRSLGPLISNCSSSFEAEYIADSLRFTSPARYACVFLGSTMLKKRPEVLLHRAINGATQRRLCVGAVIRGVPTIMCRRCAVPDSKSTLVVRAEIQPLKTTHSSSKDHEIGRNLLGPSILHETLSRERREGTFFTLRGVETNGRHPQLSSCIA